jgi:hypothetical protein
MELHGLGGLRKLTASKYISSFTGALTTALHLSKSPLHQPLLSWPCNKHDGGDMERQ